MGVVWPVVNEALNLRTLLLARPRGDKSMGALSNLADAVSNQYWCTKS